MMALCENGHAPVVHDGEVCPLCLASEKLKEAEIALGERDEKIWGLEGEVSALSFELEELKLKP